MKTVLTLTSTLALASCVLIACGAHDHQFIKEDRMSIQVSSSVIAEGQPIPQKYTCQGHDISPPLQWTGVPTNTQSFALVADDPDAPAGTWVHWVLYDMPPTTTELAEDTPKSEQLSDGTKQGVNDFHRLGYGGPCPPPGPPHHYHFKLYALDTLVNLKTGATKQELMSAMKGHVLAEGQLIGTYQRK